MESAPRERRRVIVDDAGSDPEVFDRTTNPETRNNYTKQTYLRSKRTYKFLDPYLLHECCPGGQTECGACFKHPYITRVMVICDTVAFHTVTRLGARFVAGRGATHPP